MSVSLQNSVPISVSDRILWSFNASQTVLHVLFDHLRMAEYGRIGPVALKEFARIIFRDAITVIDQTFFDS